MAALRGELWSTTQNISVDQKYVFRISVHILFADDAVEAEQGGPVQKGSLPSTGPCSEHEKTGPLLAAGYILIADAEGANQAGYRCSFLR